MNKRIGGVLAALAVVGALAGCSIADTAPNQVALQYVDGPFSSRTFASCVPTGTMQYHKMNNDHFYFPEGQRTLDFSPGSADGLAPLTVATNDGQVMEEDTLITFHLNTSCTPYTDKAGKVWPGGILQKFYETIAAQDHAYADAGAEPGPGWDAVVHKDVAAPVQLAVNNAAAIYGWQQLFEDPAAKDKWANQAKADIPALVLAQTGEDFFTIDNVTLQKPKPDSVLLNDLKNKQSANLRAQTADVDKNAALNFPGGIPAYTNYLTQLAINKAIADGHANINVVPPGAGVLTGGGR
jgi:hypothetical protein